MADILIRGMEMPKNCAECKFWCVCKPISADFDDWISIDEAVNDGFLVRHELCPLVEVKAPHGRLIDADLMKEDWQNYAKEGFFAKKAIPMLIDTYPTIIEAEGGGKE